VEIVQDFLDIVLTPLRVSVAEAELAATEQRVIASIVSLAFETRQELIHYQAAAQAVELWETVLEAQGASYELAQRMGEAGNLNNAAITNERILLEQARIDASEAAIDQQAAREKLNQLMGLWGQDVTWTTHEMLPALPVQPADVDTDIKLDVIAGSLELAAGRARLEAAARRVGLEQILQVLPMIEIGGSVESEKEAKNRLVKRRRSDGTEYELEEVPGSVEWWAGPALTIPIPLFDQGQAARARRGGVAAHLESTDGPRGGAADRSAAGTISHRRHASASYLLSRCCGSAAS
ncbi:MAG: TolC family protein, partial [Phycisphaerae bacterium]